MNSPSSVSLKLGGVSPSELLVESESPDYLALPDESALLEVFLDYL